MESIIQFKFCGHITIIKKQPTTLLFQLFRKRKMGNQSQQWLHGAYNPSSDNHLLSCSYNLFPANFRTKCRGYGHF